MRRLLTLLCVVFLPASALAAPAPGTIGIYFDSAGQSTCATRSGFTQWDFYVLTADLPGKIKAYEVGVQVPPQFSVLGAALSGPNPINIGSTGNFIVGTGGCIETGGVIRLVHYLVGYFAGPLIPEDSLFCVGPTTPTGFAPAAPGYALCDNTLLPFGIANRWENDVYPPGCSVVNATQDGAGCTVATSASSWGAVKAQF